MKLSLSKIPRHAPVMLILAVAWNELVYMGSRLIAGGLPHYDWTLPLDNLIPFVPATVIIYFACFLFWAVSYFFCACRDRAQADRFFCADFLAKAVCLVFFIVLPTTNVRPPVNGQGFWDEVMRFLYSIDAADNLFPSIHCLVSWMCFIGVRGQKNISLPLKAASFLAAIAVFVSTLTTKQHVILDVAGGVLLAELCWYLASLKPVCRRYSRVIDFLLKKRVKNGG